MSFGLILAVVVLALGAGLPHSHGADDQQHQCWVCRAHATGAAPVSLPLSDSLFLPLFERILPAAVAVPLFRLPALLRERAPPVSSLVA